MTQKLTRQQFDFVALGVLAAVLPHLQRLPTWLALALLTVLLARWVTRAFRPGWGAVPIWLRLPLTLALPLAVVSEYGTLFGREPGSALAAGMLVLKLAESEKPRDARSAVTFGCFLLMAALLFGQDLTSTVWVGLALVPQLAVLRSLQTTASTAPAPWPGTVRRAFGAASVSLLLALPVAGAGFLLLPRLTSPLWGAPEYDQGKMGVGDSMTPGGLLDLLVDDRPAFRVSFDGGVPPAAEKRYWRGKVLWDFDGTTWSNSGTLAHTASSEPLAAVGSVIDYEVTLEPTRQDKLFVLDVPLAPPEGAQRDADYVVTNDKPVNDTKRYRAQSALDYHLVGLSARQRRHALALPAGYNPRTAALAQEWRSRAGDDRDVIRYALQMIRDQFTYTLHPPALGRDSMDDFLFETRAGYCEHFASSFAVLMRAAGIPSRVVLGYQGGYWNPFANYLVVRQSDAHAWTEVWLGERGWVRVDPTGAVSPQRVQLGASAANSAEKPWYGGDFLLGLRNRWDLVNRLWNDAIVRFDALRQASILQPFGVPQADARDLGIALLCCAVAFIGLMLIWTFRRDPHAGDALDRAYARLCADLGRRGLRRTPSEGPLAYAARAAAAQPDLGPRLQALLQRYVILRYATALPNAQDVTRFARDVRDLRRRRPASPAAASAPPQPTAGGHP